MIYKTGRGMHHFFRVLKFCCEHSIWLVNLGFNVPPTAKVICRQDLGLKVSLELPEKPAGIEPVTLSLYPYHYVTNVYVFRVCKKYIFFEYLLL